MELITLTAQVQIVAGETLDDIDVPGLLGQSAPSNAVRSRERDYLFAHLTLAGPPAEAEALSIELLNGLSQHFYSSTGSVTSALRRGVLQLNERLLYHNLTMGVTHEGALTCAVLHGDELFTLQVGEALAFLGHNFGVERLPSSPPDVITPLGRSAGIDIRFAYHRLDIGDMFLLTDPRLASLAGENLITVLVDTEIETAVDELIKAIGNDSARALLVEFTDEIPASLPVSFATGTTAGAKVPPNAFVPDEILAGSRSAAGMGGPKREPGLPPLTTPTLPTIDTGHVEYKARQAAAQSARSLSGATTWLAGLTGRLDPSDEESTESSLSWALPTFVAILIPILIAIIVSSVFLRRGNIQYLGEVKQNMVEQMVMAEDLRGDPAAARQHYEVVLALAAEAEAIRPGDAQVDRMVLEAREFLDQQEGVTRLFAREFDSFEPQDNLTDITLRSNQEGGLFFHEQAGNRTFYQSTDESFADAEGDAAQIVAFGGQAVGAEIVGPLVDMIWRPGGTAGTRDGITMLDRTGVLFTYHPNLGDIRSNSLGFGSTWLNPVALATYSGRIYVLDSGSGEIWKYYPEGEGFVQNEDDKAISFSDDPGLDKAVDFDLYSEDGSLVIIYDDGRLRYYDTRSGRVQWDEQALLQNGLESPLVAPVAVEMVGQGLNASIFVLDPGSGRIIQISRGGTVLAQYRALDQSNLELISNSSDFAIAESPLRVFLVNGNQIYLATRN